MKRDEALQVILVLAGAYPNVVGRMSEQQAKAWSEVYVGGIVDLDFTQCKAAVDRLIKSSKWLSIAEIREAVISVTRGQQRSGAEAWEDVLKQVSAVGVRGRPTFADPVVAQVVRGLGWREICMSENQTADRARFIDSYDQLVAQGRLSAQVSHGAAAPALPTRGAPAALPGGATPALGQIAGGKPKAGA